LEQGDKHRRRATARHLERRRLGRRERGAPLAHLGQREPAAVGRDVAPRGGATDPGVRGAGDALLPAPSAHSPTLLSPSQGSGSALSGRGRRFPLLQRQSAKPLPLRATVGRAAVTAAYAAPAAAKEGP